MSKKANIEGLYTALEEAAGLLDTACSRERMWPVLTAFQDVIGAVVFNTVAGDSLSFDFTTPLSDGDPYERALAHGLVEEIDHPVRALFADLRAHMPLQGYGVDYAVTGIFNKAYALFPMNRRQELASLADIASMPPGLAEHMGTFAAHGLDGKISAIAVDYASRTWNVYFNGLSAQHVERGALRALLADFGMPDPSEELLAFAEGSAALYPTFGWDSAKIDRVSFSRRTTDPVQLPAHVEPSLDKLARNAPYTYDGERIMVYAGVLAPDREYYKLATYHHLASAALDRVRSRN
ncbi:aromatic prenyltransferase [Streptomyces venezuelae]|uniref:Prenyltransferase n=1 Tax=Streptomyces venezuelae TaxID=54571 RepID=A0A5P2BNR7_STRVZ|nr:aromatic prenyltransferase [Streptomyces venezuelae]QES32115.1 hypothetical protein DEJ48_00585 [Streptomyces venezuelae]